MGSDDGLDLTAVRRFSHRGLFQAWDPGGGEAGGGRLLGEPDGVADGAAAGVVVEVDVGVGAGADQVGQAPGPGGQGRAVVAGAGGGG